MSHVCMSDYRLPDVHIRVQVAHDGSWGNVEDALRRGAALAARLRDALKEELHMTVRPHKMEM